MSRGTFAKNFKISTTHHEFDIGRSSPFGIIPSHFPLLIFRESKSRNNWSAESEHIFNIAGDTRGRVYICQCDIPSLYDLERQARERERERERERAEGLLELLEVVSIGFWCQEHVLRYRGKSSPRRLPPCILVRSTLTTSHSLRDSFSWSSCKKRREKEKEPAPVRKIMAPREGIAALGKE